MAYLTLSQWSEVIQLIVGVVTSIGVIASLYFSLRALREIRLDRDLRHKPYLAFEGGGFRTPIHFVKAGRRVPGMAPNYVEKVFADLPNDAESVRIKTLVEDNGKHHMLRVGRLKNFGLGPAFESRVIWIAQRVTIGSETFELDDKKLREPRYSEAFNRMPSMPQHIMPEQESGLTRLPTFIEKDCERKIKEVEGILQIECEDMFGKTHTTLQCFWLGTNYTNEHRGPSVDITFREVIHAIDSRNSNRSQN